MKCQVSNLGLSCARQMPYPLYHCSSPKQDHLRSVNGNRGYHSEWRMPKEDKDWIISLVRNIKELSHRTWDVYRTESVKYERREMKVPRDNEWKNMSTLGVGIVEQNCCLSIIIITIKLEVMVSKFKRSQLIWHVCIILFYYFGVAEGSPQCSRETAPSGNSQPTRSVVKCQAGR